MKFRKSLIGFAALALVAFGVSIAQASCGSSSLRQHELKAGQCASWTSHAHDGGRRLRQGAMMSGCGVAARAR